MSDFDEEDQIEAEMIAEGERREQIRAAVLAEREACAKIAADATGVLGYDAEPYAVAEYIGRKIRARGAVSDGPRGAPHIEAARHCGWCERPFTECDCSSGKAEKA